MLHYIQFLIISVFLASDKVSKQQPCVSHLNCKGALQEQCGIWMLTETREKHSLQSIYCRKVCKMNVEKFIKQTPMEMKKR